jgi:GTPase SAR1 family protein
MLGAFLVTVGVLAVGNSGVGKSLLNNILLKKERFEHKIGPSSVTEAVDLEPVDSGTRSGGRVAIFDIPGLIECDSSKIQRNKDELEKAFQGCNEQVVAFVFGCAVAGRILAEDLQAFKSIVNAYEVKPESLVFVCNKIPRKFTEVDKAEAMYVVRTQLAILLKTDAFDLVPFVFVKDFGDDFDTFPYDREDIQAARQALLEAAFSRCPARHKKEREIDLSPDAELVASLNTQINEQKKENEKNKEEHAKELVRINEGHAEAMKDAQEKSRREIEEYKSRQPQIIYIPGNNDGGSSCVVC